MIIKKHIFLPGVITLAFLIGLSLLLKPSQAAAVSSLDGSGEGLRQASLSGPQSPLACNIDVPGMIAYWPADSLPSSQLVDQVGGHTGSCSGDSCPKVVTGKVNNALQFEGADQLNVPDAPEFNWNNTDSFSVELWVKMGGDCSAQRQVFVGKYKGSLGTLQSWWVGCEVTNQAAFNLRDSNGQYLTINGGPALNDGNWHHVIAVRDAAETRNLLYVDGALATAQIQSYAGNFFDNRELNFGYYNVDPYYYFTGWLDEISMYNRALTLEEVLVHYNGGAGKAYCNQPPDAVDDGPYVAVLNTPLTIPVEALLWNDRDPDGDPLVITAIGPALNGTVTGSGPYIYTPTTGYLGPDSFQYTISDQVTGTDTATVALTVRVKNDAPTLNQPANRTDPEGASISLQLQASDPDGDPLIYTATNLPPGVSLNRDTGLISGALSYDASSGIPYTVQVTVTDAGFKSNTKSFQWAVTDVNGGPVLQQPSNQFNNEGDRINLQIEASDPDNDPLVYSIANLPPGLSFDQNTGLISGGLSYTAAAGSPYTVQVTVTDPLSQSDAKTFIWIINKSGPAQIYLPLILNNRTVN